MKRAMFICAISAFVGLPASGQSFFSFSASSDGVGMTIGDMFMPPPPPPVRVVDVRVPFLPGYGYEVCPPSHHMSKKARKKAAKRYRKAMHRAVEAWGPISLMYGVPAALYYSGCYDDDDNDHHHYKHHSKHHKRYKKHHHRHHGHDDDD